MPTPLGTAVTGGVEGEPVYGVFFELQRSADETKCIQVYGT